MGVMVLSLVAWLGFPGSLSDSTWFLPVYSESPVSGPGVNLYLQTHTLEAVPLRFAHDPTLLPGLGLRPGLAGALSVRLVSTQKPVTTAYSRQGLDQELSSFGAFFGMPQRVTGSFDYAQRGTEGLEDWFVGHTLLLHANASLKGIGFSGTALSLSSSEDNGSSSLFATGQISYAGLGLRLFGSSCSRDTLEPESFSSFGLRGAFHIGSFEAFSLWERLGDDSLIQSTLRPGLRVGLSKLQLSGSWFIADSGSGPCLEAGFLAESLQARIAYTTELVDPSLMTRAQPIRRADASIRARFRGLAVGAEASSGQWPLVFDLDSVHHEALVDGIRAGTGLSYSATFGPVETGSRARLSYFSKGSPAQVLWRVEQQLGLRVGLLSGNLVFRPGLRATYFGDPWDRLWWSASVDAFFYDAVRLNLALDNPTDAEDVRVMDYTWPGRSWRVGVAVVLWD